MKLTICLALAASALSLSLLLESPVPKADIQSAPSALPSKYTPSSTLTIQPATLRTSKQAQKTQRWVF